MSDYQHKELLKQLQTLHAELTDDLSRSSNRGEYIQIAQRIERVDGLLKMCAILDSPKTAEAETSLST